MDSNIIRNKMVYGNREGIRYEQMSLFDVSKENKIIEIGGQI